jgi:MFS family permease
MEGAADRDGCAGRGMAFAPPKRMHVGRPSPPWARNVGILGLAAFFTDVASEMVYPVLPFFLTAALGVGPAILGTIEGVADSAASLLRVASGWLSDRLHRRKALTIAGYGASAVGKALLPLATGWAAVLLARLVDRIGKGIRTAPRDALVVESATAETRGRAFGLHRALDTLGAVVGVAIAYVVLTSHPGAYAAVFVWALVPAVLGVLVLALVRDPRVLDARPAFAERPRWHTWPPALRWFLVIALVFALGNSSNAFLLLRASTLGQAPTTSLLLYLVYNVVYAAVSYPAGRLSDRVGRRALLVAGYAIYAVVYVGVALLRGSQDAWLLWPAFAVYGLYAGLTDGIERAVVAELAPASARGTALGLHATIVGAALLPASLLAGALWERFGAAATFAFGGVIGAVAAVGMALVLRPARASPST